MSLQPKTEYTPEEYLALERNAEAKSEYFAGEIFLMAGASERHNLIVANLIAEFRSQFKNRACKVYPSDMRVKVSASGLYTYPDVTVVCGEPQFEDEHKDTLLNPTLIIEVLSESSEAYDRGKNFEHYRSLKTLSDYLIIAQDKRVLSVRRREISS
jgi:Uma2 family endonuclease